MRRRRRGEHQDNRGDYGDAYTRPHRRRRRKCVSSSDPPLRLDLSVRVLYIQIWVSGCHAWRRGGALRARVRLPIFALTMRITIRPCMSLPDYDSWGKHRDRPLCTSTIILVCYMFK
jgi:hypothetical protein